MFQEDWCMTGCGKQSQLGSIYCSMDCFRQDLQSDQPSSSDEFSQSPPIELGFKSLAKRHRIKIPKVCCPC